MAFERLIGQSKVKEILSELYVSGRVGHAYLFNGPSGIGKRSFAKEFSSLIMCPSAIGDSRCGKCECCVLMDSGTNPDYSIIGVASGKSSIGVEAVRELQNDVITAPVFGKRKVYVIENAEKMTEQAQNALLKILEEPPAYAVIILICSNILSLLGTVRSRVTRIDFIRNSDEEIKVKYRQLCEEKGIEAESDKIELLCAYADGIMGRVDDFTDGSSVREKRSEIMGLLKKLLSGELTAKMKLAEVIDARNGNYDFALFTMMSYLRDTMLVSRMGKWAHIQNLDYRDDIYELGRNIGYYRAKECLEIVDSCYRSLNRNAAPDLTVDYMLIKLQEAT